jgi:hypothetical protein
LQGLRARDSPFTPFGNASLADVGINFSLV